MENRTRMGEGLADERACGNVPDFDCAVRATGNDTRRVGTEFRAIDFRAVNDKADELRQVFEFVGQKRSVSFGSVGFEFGLERAGIPRQGVNATAFVRGAEVGLDQLKILLASGILSGGLEALLLADFITQFANPILVGGVETEADEYRDTSRCERNACELLQTALGGAGVLERFAATQDREVGVHFLCGAIALVRIVLAGLEENEVQFEQPLLLLRLPEERRQFGKLHAVLAGAHFVEHFAEAVDVGLLADGTFRRQETFRADVGNGCAHIRDQPDVRELGHAVDEDNIGRFDVAVDEAVRVQVLERPGEREAYVQRAIVGQSAVGRDFAAESFWFVSRRIDLALEGRTLRAR